MTLNSFVLVDNLCERTKLEGRSRQVVASPLRASRETTRSHTGNRSLRSCEKTWDADVAHALVRTASRLFGTPGGGPLNLRVLAGHPDESCRGAHE
jgi:hypothetical protein